MDPSDSRMRTEVEALSGELLGEGVDLGTRWVPNHGAAANGLSAVRSMDGHFPGRRVRPIGGHEAVADLIR